MEELKYLEKLIISLKETGKYIPMNKKEAIEVFEEAYKRLDSFYSSNDGR
jgi:hypothetical protein